MEKWEGKNVKEIVYLAIKIERDGTKPIYKRKNEQSKCGNETGMENLK